MSPSPRPRSPQYGFQTSRRSAFTILELLVVLAIFALLMALLLPAVQASRESMRRIECVNHLKQLGIAMISHEETYGHYPTGGWGFRWVGDPRRGTGKSQPGGWVFAVLPYIEQEPDHNMGWNASSEAERRSQLAAMASRGHAVFHCPSRRPVGPYPTQWQAFNTDFVTDVAKTDYAANAGSVFRDVGPGPVTLAQGDSRSYVWPEYKATGICFLRSMVKSRDVTDGTSNTILLGEKNLPRARYHTGDDRGDDQSMYSGDDYDTLRWALAAWTPLNDEPGDNAEARFGSAHSAGCNVLLCDGSARLASYSIDQTIYEHLGNRSDGETLSEW